MQLLYSSIIPVVEFASVSLLLKDSSDGTSPSSGSMGESIIVASPLSTTTSAPEYLIELHDYLSSVYENIPSNNEKTIRGTDSSQQFGHDDGTLLQSSQIFRSSQGHGMGLYYHVVRTTDFIKACFGVLMGRYARGVELDSVAGVVICCGVAGLSTSHVSSALINQIMPRMQEVASNMRRIGNVSDAEQCKVCYKALLSSMLLTEDEERRTNAMVDAELVRMALDLEDGEQSRRFRNRGPPPRAGLRKGLSSERITIEAESSADWARMMEKRSAVLSVAEKDASLRRYEASGQQRRTTIDIGRTTRRRKKAVDEADLKHFEFSKWKRSDSSSAPIRASTPGRVPRSYRDTPRIPGPRPNTIPTPPGQRNRPGRRPSHSVRNNSGGRRQDAFDVFGSEDMEPNGPLNGFHGIQFPGLPLNNNHNDYNNSTNHNSVTSNSEGSWGASNDRHRDSNGFDPFAMDAEIGNTSPSVPSTLSSGMLTPASTGRTSSVSDDIKMPLENGHIESLGSRDESVFPDNSPPYPQRNNELGSVDGSEAARGRIQVNIALNEDLTCSYRNSKISSCTIEGVVQVQVRSDSQSVTPFFLLLRDPSRHIRMIQENRRYADDMTEALSEQNEDDNGVDYKFTISVPRADNYFPVMRYKCSNELRPVPIRVQTRVRLSGGLCRVALQISSNPANEDDLTDLTIIMGVPIEVRGETLTTSPPGGVWNAARRSVIWCVAELGDGEKFQLQAQFEIEQGEHERPKFPVLVRCQCMYAQLSDIELEVADIPEILPAEVTMRLARRFRLSHRERS